MGNILHETLEKTLIERLAEENPEIFFKFSPLFSEKIDVYVPLILLEGIVYNLNQRLYPGHTVSAIASREERDGTHSKQSDNSNANYLLKLDRLIDLYSKRWMVTAEPFADILMEDIMKINGQISQASYFSDFNNVRRIPNGPLAFNVFSALINREASDSIGESGFQKMEGVVYVRDKDNPKRFTQLVVNEISRDAENSDVGHFLVSCKNSISDQLSHHVWLFPNRKRLFFNRFPGLFKKYLQDSGSDTMPLFEWIEKTSDRDIDAMRLEELAEHPEHVIDDSSVIADIMRRSETHHYSRTVNQINRRIGTIFLPADISREVEKAYSSILQGGTLTKPNRHLMMRSHRSLVELDTEKLKRFVVQSYLGSEINVRYVNDEKLRFSILYDQHQSSCTDPDKKEYSVFQLYVHRPSSTTEGEKFESFLEIVNTRNSENKYTLKIDELKRYNGRGLYAIETFTYGNKVEHHLQVVEASHDVMIDLNRMIRDIVKKNGYRSAPDYIHIWNKIKSA